MESLATFGQTQGVTVEAPEVSVTIWADADRIVQVLVNLLSNAVKFSPPGGVVTSAVVLHESGVEFRVTDRGRGVPAAHHRTIFERFRQVETSDAREKGGTGLGLAICKSIVEQHGGTIGVESAEGDSSTFWFRVPPALRPVAPGSGPGVLILFGSPRVVSPEALADSLVLFVPEHVDSAALLAAIRHDLERDRVAAQARHVLLVEDDLTLLDVMARQLSLDGITVRTAATGEEAIRIAETEPPALMVLDIGLPERDGFDVVDAMRQRPRMSGVPVLVFTARELTEEQRGRLRLGPTRFLTKSRASDEDFRRLVVELRS